MTSRSRWAAVIVAALAIAVLAALLLGSLSRTEDSGRSARPVPTVVAGRDDAELEDHEDHGLRAAETAARAFLRGYLRLAYGKPGVTAADLDRAAPALVARLQADGGRVTPQQTRETAVVDVVSLVGEGATGALATAQIHERRSGFRYVLVFRLASDPAAGWLVTRIGA